MLSALLTLACGSALVQHVQESHESIVILAQDDSGDRQGSDHVAIQEALDSLGVQGGTLLLGPGVYEIRRTVNVPSGVTIRGSEGTRLQLPPPSLFAADAARGATEIELEDVTGFRVGDALELLPPIEEGLKWPPGTPQDYCWCRVVGIEGSTLRVERPLARAMPAGSRIAYQHRMLRLHAVQDVTIVGLSIDGGRVEGIDLPGHHQRTAIWVSAPMNRSEGRLGPPSSNITVRDCEIRNCYGRAVAYYYTVDGQVIDCTIDGIADEAIDFDHYTERCVASGNRISRAVWGVTINDASRCVVERNEITDCRVGITIWRFLPATTVGINEENVIQHNLIKGSQKYSIHIGKDCHRNEVLNNSFESPLVTTEATTVVEGNTRRP